MGHELARGVFLAQAMAGQARPDLRSTEEEDHILHLTVVFTSEQGTGSALRKAAALAGPMSARITLIAPQIVPYPRPLNSPPVGLEFTQERLRALASRIPVEIEVRVVLCRDLQDAWAKELKPHSVVVLGGSKGWWPTTETRLARNLRKAGHEVIVTETE
jgi:hypothetical protein